MLDITSKVCFFGILYCDTFKVQWKSMTSILLQIYSWLQQWKHFENWSVFPKSRGHFIWPMW